MLCLSVVSTLDTQISCPISRKNLKDSDAHPLLWIVTELKGTAAIFLWNVFIVTTSRFVSWKMDLSAV